MRSPIRVPITLTCPDCSGESLLPATLLLAGRSLACPHCGIELTLSHDRDTPDGPPVWRLEVPDLTEDHAAGA